jgi:type I restriction enzyme S subunit
MTHQELKQSILVAAVFGKITQGCEWNEEDNPSLFRYIWEVTYWDKKFKDVDRKKQPKTISYSHVLARDYKSIEVANGDVFILSTGLYEGYTSKEKLTVEPSEGEVVSIPGGGSPSVKYWKGRFVTADNRIATSRDTNILLNKYLYYYLQSQTDYLDSIYRGTGLRHPKMALVLDMRLPVPSIEEQNKIVCIIEELLPLVDEYGAVELQLKELNADFQEKIRKSILQQAIQGKLTERDRDPADEPASELLKRIRAEKEQLIREGKIKKEKSPPPITEDEIPFEIPENWTWVRLSDIGEVSRGRSKHRPRNDRNLYDNGTYPMIQTGDVARSNGRITKCSAYYNDKGLEQSRIWPKGTLCLTIAANIGDVGILEFDSCFPDSVVGFNAFKPIENNEYFLYLLMAYKTILDKKATKSAQKNINLEKISSLAYPLPPLAEQQRIVDRVNELLALCDELKMR